MFHIAACSTLSRNGRPAAPSGFVQAADKGQKRTAVVIHDGISATKIAAGEIEEIVQENDENPAPLIKP
jgi:hypothetical protein